MFKDEVHDIGAPNPLGDRDRRERQLQDFLAATLDPLERRVFVLHYRDEMSIVEISVLLKLHSIGIAESSLVSARGKIAKASIRFGMHGECL